MSGIKQNYSVLKNSVVRVFRALWTQKIYKIFIEPKSIDEDERRREMIFNVIATSLFVVLCLLGLSVLYADMTGVVKGGFNFLNFSLFPIFFGSLLLLSRKGHYVLATYLFLGLYFLATTWGEYKWGTAIPLALLSYGAIIVMTSVLLGTRTGFVMTGAIIITIISLGYMQTHGIIDSDITWRFTQLEFKDVFENSFIFLMIVVVSWLSNREIERSLKRARASEKALAHERDLLEIKVEERTKELKAAELEKVSQLYRFVEFGRLASGIFHDLLNPLSAVAMSIEKLESDQKSISDGEKLAKEYINRALSASKRMETFIQTARKQLDATDSKQEFLANKEISDAVDLLLHKSNKNEVEIKLVAPHEVIINGNPIKLFQIAVNLISNAIDSYDDMPELENKNVIVSLTEDKGIAKLSVVDHGCGIRPEHKLVIFEPFFSTKNLNNRQDSGLGLGLSTTKENIEKDFAGTLSLETELGKGSTFTVLIPTNLHEKTKIQRKPNYQSDRKSH